MKYKYCHNCKKAYVKSRLEKDHCMYCNQPCETVDVKRNGLYYAGNMVMIAGATLSLVPRLTTTSGSTFYFVMGIVILLGGIVLVMLGGARMAKSAATQAGAGLPTDTEESDPESSIP